LLGDLRRRVAVMTITVIYIEVLIELEGDIEGDIELEGDIEGDIELEGDIEGDIGSSVLK